MSSARIPNVFISSTFFDLQQVRTDLARFIESEMGYRFLASEHASFPIDPDIATVENCRARVQHDADILVLVIGGRYGTVDAKSAKSVTNLEYTVARAKPIPVYAFVQRDVLAILPIWESNPSADYAKVVDTTRVFEFLKQVRTADSVWTFPFTNAQEIAGTLRAQFAYSMTRGLYLQARLRPKDALRNFDGEALKIAVDQNAGWPARLLAQAVRDELARYADGRRDYDFGIALGVGETVADADAPAFLLALTDQAKRTITGVTTIMVSSMNAAVEDADVDLIASSARRIGLAYKEALDWSSRIRRAVLPDDWRPVFAALAVYLRNLLDRMEQFGDDLDKIVEEMLTRPPSEREVVKYTFQVGVFGQDAFLAAMDDLRRKRGMK
jgi:hypothetical protein